MPSGFPFSDHAYVDDFMLLFCRGRLRNVHSFKTHVLSYCSAHLIFFLPRLRYHRSRGLLKVPIKTVEPSSVANKYIYRGTLENELKGKVPLSTRLWLDSLVVYDRI